MLCYNRLAKAWEKSCKFFTQLFRVLDVLAGRGARAVRNVFCFKAAEHFASSEKKKIKVEFIGQIDHY